MRPALRGNVVQYRQQGKSKERNERFLKVFYNFLEEFLDIESVLKHFRGSFVFFWWRNSGHIGGHKLARVSVTFRMFL